VKEVEDALGLVNNPAYIPSSFRTGQQSKIEAVQEKLIAARRSIDEDKESQGAIAKMKEKATAGETKEGYTIRRELIAKFPGLDTNASMVEATKALAEKERELVKVSAVQMNASPDDPQADQVQKIPAST